MIALSSLAAACTIIGAFAGLIIFALLIVLASQSACEAHRATNVVKGCEYSYGTHMSVAAILGPLSTPGTGDPPTPKRAPRAAYMALRSAATLRWLLRSMEAFPLKKGKGTKGKRAKRNPLTGPPSCAQFSKRHDWSACAACVMAIISAWAVGS